MPLQMEALQNLPSRYVESCGLINRPITNVESHLRDFSVTLWSTFACVLRKLELRMKMYSLQSTVQTAYSSYMLIALQGQPGYLHHSCIGESTEVICGRPHNRPSRCVASCG